MIIGTNEGKDVRIDIDRLIETRMLVEANSGAGKSWAIRRILEQSHGSVQHLVIDPEGEFYTLRERYDYVLAGKGGDCPADPRCAALLATRLLELGTSAILDIYELHQYDRVRFVKLFLEALVNAPKSLWHPALVVIDEAHMFAPESAKAESAQAVIDLMTRGRKRGFAGLLATQRPAALDKNASAQCNNKLIGRFSQDIDVKRAADDIGFHRREDQAALRTLKAGQFFAVGPAIADQVTRVTVGVVITTHPKAGQRAAAPPPPPATVRAVLAQLADLPAEAEEEARTSAELRKEIAELKRVAKAPAIDESVIQAAEQRGYAVAKAEEGEARKNAARAVHECYVPVFDALRDVLKLAASAEQFQEAITAPPPFVLPAGAIEKIQAAAARVVEASRTSGPASKPSRQSSPPTCDLKGPEQRILNAIAWLQSIGVDQPEQTAVAFLAGYTYGGGAFNNPRGSLRSKGLVEYVGDCISLTEAGRDAAQFPEGILTTDELHRRVLDRLPGPEQKLLRVILDAHPKAITNETCARAAGYTPNAGAYNNPRGRLRSLGLIDYPQPGHVRARDLLFLGGTR